MAILLLSALPPASVIAFLLTDGVLVGIAGFGAAHIRGLWVARASGYEPTGWQSRDTGALADGNLRRMADAAGWPTQWLARARWLAAGALGLALLAGLVLTE